MATPSIKGSFTETVYTGNTGSQTVNKPAGAATGDIYVVTAVIFRYLSADPDVFTGPSGFTEITQSPTVVNWNLSSVRSRVGVWAKKYDGSEGATFTVSSRGDYWTLSAFIVQDADVSGTIAEALDGTPVSTGADSTVGASLPEVTTTQAGSLALAWLASNHAEITSDPSGWTLRDTADGDYADTYSKPMFSAGSTGTSTWSTGGTDALLSSVWAFKAAEPPNTIATDDFNTLGTATLDSIADWETYTRAGSGVPTGDLHPDHSDGTRVVDMSDSGSSARSIWQTAMGDTDHWAEVEVFVDSYDTSNNKLGPMVRLSDSNPDNNSTLDGYVGYMTNTGSTIFVIGRIDNGSVTAISSTGDLEATYSTDVRHMLRLEVVGSTLTLYVDGVEVVSTTDTTYTAGSHVGVQSDRITGAVDSQPFFDNFSAGDWTPPVTEVTIDPIGSASTTVSDTAQITSPGTPLAITDLAGTPGSSGEVNLTWTAPTGVQ